jgi:hypothetical protein
MTVVAVKGLLGRKLRSILTGLAIVLGVAMISGTYRPPAFFTRRIAAARPLICCRRP